ncbi:MAG: hypothetical protein E6R03_01945 [Hyphomicrobiaceae bacterium]|nr:MAG: hypothetical protein E6R03_01945 [Hyphomicrobiaceae bacterium]
MMDLLHNDFEDSEEAFQSARTFWGKVFRWAIPLDSDPQFQVDYVRPSRDGNPIFSAIHVHSGDAVRIVQHKPSVLDEFDVDWWIYSTADGVPELVLSCCPSRQNLKEILWPIRTWISRRRVMELVPFGWNPSRAKRECLAAYRCGERKVNDGKRSFT